MPFEKITMQYGKTTNIFENNAQPTNSNNFFAVIRICIPSTNTQNHTNATPIVRLPTGRRCSAHAHHYDRHRRQPKQTTRTYTLSRSAGRRGVRAHSRNSAEYPASSELSKADVATSFSRLATPRPLNTKTHTQHTMTAPDAAP